MIRTKLEHGFSDVELCEMFNWDAGILCGVKELEGTSLFEFKSTQRVGRDIVNPDTMTPQELKQAQNAERAERVEKMRNLLTPQKLAELKASDSCITDLLPPPILV